MIPFFGTGITNDSKAFSVLSALGNSYLSRRNENINPIQVEAQVPYWMTKNSDGDGNPSQMINFLQSYYDWLTNNYGYENTNVFDITKLFDVNFSPSFLLEHFVNTFASDISSIYQLPASQQPTPDQIRNTIVNIKTEIYNEKSTETVFKRLLNSLFGIDPNQVTITYPKSRLMRLNGGILPWMSNGMNESISQFMGSTGEYSNERYSLIGSYLNNGVLYDNNLWQEYSYVVDSPIDESNVYYEETVRTTLHPAGFKAFFEKRELFAEVAPPDIGQESVYEIPVVANYYPYRLDSVESLDRCVGCTGESSVPGWETPTFVFPNWDIKIKNRNAERFGDIQILSEFTLLTTPPGTESPNNIIGNDCDYACGFFGGVSFYGLCGGLPNQPYFGITMALTNSLIKFFNDSDFGFNTFSWKLGDETPGDETDLIVENNINFEIPSVEHTYAEDGLYYVEIIGTKANGFTASFGKTLDVGSVGYNYMTCPTCFVNDVDVYAKKNVSIDIVRNTTDPSRPGSSPFTYTWNFQDGSSSSSSQDSTQVVTFNKVNAKKIILATTNRFGSSSASFEVRVVDLPVIGITHNYGSLYVFIGDSVSFDANITNLNGHKETEIAIDWYLNSNYQISSTQFPYTFNTGGTYNIGISYSSLIYSEFSGSTTYQIYVGDVPTSPTFIRTPTGIVYVLEGITFEGTN